VIGEELTPRDAPAYLRELSPDVHAAVLLDAAGALVATSEEDPEQADELASLVRELVEAADAAAPDGPPEQVEAQVDSGAVFVTRDPRFVLACVTRRAALPSLMLYDQRMILGSLAEGAS
jgi:hypothetical protein